MFHRSVCREFGVQIGRVTLAFMVFGAGMFISSTAFLPSTFSMYMCLVSMGAWFHRKYELAVFTTALSAFLSWPFAALLGVPIAIDMVFYRKEVFKFVQWSCISTAIVLIPMVKMDSSYFGRLVVAPYNIIHYNIFSHGPDLYGTESWTFYFINGFLNFNFAFIGALLMPFLLEERFLFPAYPLVCLCGAVAVDCVQKLCYRFALPRPRQRSGPAPRHYLHSTAPLLAVAVAVCAALGVARALALYNGYHAPLDVFMELNSLNAEYNMVSKKTINVCMGKEWHRFPSSFFLPGDNSQHNGTAIIPSHMNNLNKEEPSRYFDVNQCHFLVDLDLGVETEREPNYSQQKNQWTIHKSIPFLNAAKSHQFFRAFYVPYFSNLYCTYASYNLLISSKLKFLNGENSGTKR
ncbi:Mannosyltransferase [Gryllus bimaculatus]|nr:Mannosyltransferase [Gryllus bimaculatus]